MSTTLDFVSPVYLAVLVFPAAVAFGAAMDLVSMTIPNKVSLLLVAAFGVAAAVIGMPLADIAVHLGVGFGMLVVGFILFARGYIGGGDAKLLAAASLWIGFDQLGAFIGLVGILGGVLTFAILYYRAMWPPLFALRHGWMMRLHEKNEGIPYGVAIGLGAMMIFPGTPWFAAAI